MHKKILYNQARGIHMIESEFAEKYDYKKVHTPPIRKYIIKVK